MHGVRRGVEASAVAFRRTHRNQSYGDGMMKRPPYVHCIKKEELTWCGRRHWDMEWLFQSLEHAIQTIKTEGSVVPCAACTDTARGWLDQVDRDFGEEDETWVEVKET